MNKKAYFYEEIIRKNPLLMTGYMVAPLLFYATTFYKALIFIGFFSIHTVLTLIINSFISRKINYASRIMFYCIVSALVYIPVALLYNSFFPNVLTDLGIFSMLIVVNPFIVTRSEMSFYRKKESVCIIEIILSMIGYDLAFLIFAFFRELISTGEINGHIIGIGGSIPFFVYPFGACILLGFNAAFIKFFVVHKS